MERTIRRFLGQCHSHTDVDLFVDGREQGWYVWEPRKGFHDRYSMEEFMAVFGDPKVVAEYVRTMKRVQVLSPYLVQQFS